MSEPSSPKAGASSPFQGFSLERFYQLNRRALIWLSLFVLLYLLRGFFGLLFLTFVFSFIASHMVHFAQRRLHLPRRSAVLIVFGVFLIAVVAFIRFAVPRIIDEANEVTAQLGDIPQQVVEVNRQLTADYPALRPITMALIYSGLSEQALETFETRWNEAPPPELALTPRDAQQSAAASNATGEVADDVRQMRRNQRDNQLIDLFFQEQIHRLREYMPNVLALAWKSVATLLLAFLFSFLISIDIARLGQEIKNLKHSRLHDFYEQTAHPVVRFGYVLGRAIQAQAMIACVNTLLTLVGLLVLGIPALAVLSMIVFVCSFIPVLGVFLSTTPIVLVALNTGGLDLVIGVVLMIVVVHMVEAYILNPLIYGHHLKLNPVLVLVILFIGHHLFGVWGMLLGVPVSHYVLHDVFGVPVWSHHRLAQPPTNPFDRGPRPAPEESGQEPAEGFGRPGEAED